MKFVFDTSFLIDGLRRKKGVREILSVFEASDYELFTSSIVAFELFSGASSAFPEQEKRIRQFLRHFEIVDLTWSMAEKAGVIYRNGIKGLQVPDYVIAVTAIELGAQVVTLNRKHFEKIPGLLIYPL